MRSRSYSTSPARMSFTCCANLMLWSVRPRRLQQIRFRRSRLEVILRSFLLQRLWKAVLVPRARRQRLWRAALLLVLRRLQRRPRPRRLRTCPAKAVAGPLPSAPTGGIWSKTAPCLNGTSALIAEIAGGCSRHKRRPLRHLRRSRFRRLCRRFLRHPRRRRLLRPGRSTYPLEGQEPERLRGAVQYEEDDSPQEIGGCLLRPLGSLGLTGPLRCGRRVRCPGRHRS